MAPGYVKKLPLTLVNNNNKYDSVDMNQNAAHRTVNNIDYFRIACATYLAADQLEGLRSYKSINKLFCCSARSQLLGAW